MDVDTAGRRLAPADDLLLPPDACVVHIGPYKTGSTSVQQAMHERREELAAHGVVYPGRTVRPVAAGYAVLGYRPRGGRPLRMQAWHDLVDEVRRASDKRVCVSTEDWGSASTEVAGRIVSELGVERVHVVAVARRLDRLLPSQWQERIKDHETRHYDDWLKLVLGDDPTHREWQRFWASHDLVRMHDRWRPWIGPDRFSFVVADESDPTFVTDVFERMFGLPTGMLAVETPSNTSLSANATEMLRRLNEIAEAEGWPDESYRRVVQRGAVLEMREAPRAADEPRIPRLPRWAAERVAELSEERLQAFAQRGIRLIGDADSLRVAPAEAARDQDTVDAPGTVRVETVYCAMKGVVDAAVRELPDPRPARRKPRAAPPLAQIPTKTLVREAAARGVRKVRRKARWRR